jgi:Transglycosylase SLT domain
MRPVLRNAFALLALGLLAACGTTGGVSGPGGGVTGPGGIFSNEVTGKTAWEQQPDGRAWSQMARTAIDVDGVALTAANPSDMNAFCPSYATLDPQAKREFWVVLVSEIANAESALNPMAVKPPSPGAPQARRGLMAISVDAATRYGCANVGVAQLNDPQTNIGCGVKILAATSGRDQVVLGYTPEGWKGAARYWVDLRKPEALADMQDHLNNQTFCRRKGA